MSILVWIEQIEGTAVSSCWEVLGKAKSLAAELGTSAAAVVAGDGVDELAQQALSYGASAVYTASSPVLARFRLQPYTTVLDAAIDAADASVVLTSATNQGRILAATVACKRNAGLAPNASDLRVEGGALVAERTVYSGNIVADIHFESDLSVAAVRPRSFPMPEPAAADGDVHALPLSLNEDDVRVKITDFRAADTGEINLTDARIIVSGGRGVAADPEKGFQLVADLAGVLGAAVGASRAAVDAGYIPYKHQVGQTGKTVKPDLYIAAGIS
ncbi:MAG: electron transfer flavoprotein subunit alpha/FixB family protein, partial [Caldilineaceae bacterium]|nr:electron transfer flavoprotein subunit alpha/FixB family protein [Caldilineaceae bacterium]